MNPFLIMLLGLLALNAAVALWGADSRDGRDWKPAFRSGAGRARRSKQ